MLVIVNHWYEIRIRFFYTIFSFVCTFVVSYGFSDILMYLYVFPFLDKLNDKKFIFTDLSEAFSSCLLVSFHTAFVPTCILFVYTLFCFLKPGLYKKELCTLKFTFRLLIFCLLVSIILIYEFILPSVIGFFVNFESSRLFELTLEAKILDYLDLILRCVFWVCIFFQVPTLLFLSIYFQLVKVETLIDKRREYIIVCFIFGAILSPPDVLTQLLIAVPLWILSEIAILCFIVLNEYDLVTVESCSNGKR